MWTCVFILLGLYLEVEFPKEQSLTLTGLSTPGHFLFIPDQLLFPFPLTNITHVYHSSDALYSSSAPWTTSAVRKI